MAHPLSSADAKPVIGNGRREAWVLRFPFTNWRESDHTPFGNVAGFAYRNESSFGFGSVDGGSLAGNESASVLSSIFSRLPCRSSGFTGRSSGSLPGNSRVTNFVGSLFCLD